MILTRLVVSVLTATVIAVIPVASSHAGSTHRPAVGLENGILINSRAGYYFTMPQGWVLDSSSDYEDVKVSHPDSGAVLTVNYDHARGTPSMYYMSMLWSLESPDLHWLTFGKGQIMLGGREAMGFRGTREKDGKKIKELIWVALVGEYTYLLSATVDLAKFDERAPQIDQIFTSFSWGTPPRAP